MTAILANAKQFSQQTEGLTRAQELKWFSGQLGIDEAQLLVLIGYSPAEIGRRRKKGQTFEELAEAKPDQTVWVSELFRELAHRSGYDVAHMAARIEHPPSLAEVGAPSGLPELVRAIQVGGPGVLDWLTNYLRLARPAPAGKTETSV